MTDNDAAASGASAKGNADAASHASPAQLESTGTRRSIPAHLGHTADDGAEKVNVGAATELGDDVKETATPTADAGSDGGDP